MTAGKLMIVSAILMAFLLVFALLNERTLPLFGGDRALAARFMKTIFALLGGLAFALAQPALWGWFARVAQRVLAKGGSEFGKNLIERGGLADTFQTLGFVALGVFGLGAMVVSWAIWSGRS